MTSSIGKTLLGMFVETEDEPTPPTLQAAAPIAPTPQSQATASVSIPAMIDQEMVNTLQAVINGRKTAYTALLEASERLRNVIPDDVTRIKAAYAMISGDGQRSLESITQAIDVHVNDVTGEVMRFKQASEQALSTKVSALRASVSNIKATNDSRQQSIANLQQQIVALQQSITSDSTKSTELSTQADAAELEIKGVADKFVAAAEFIKTDLSSKKAQLSTVLS